MQGEQIFDALGARWTFFFGSAAKAALEEHYDRGWFAVLCDAMPIEAAMEGGDFTLETLKDPARMVALAKDVRHSVMRDLVWFGLRKHHPGVTIAQIDDMIDELGDAKFGELVGKGLAGTADKGAGKGDGDDAAPGKPRRRATAAKGLTGTV